MDVASSVRLRDELEVYCVSRLCGFVGSNVTVLPCFVLEEVVAVKAEAGVVRKERKSSRSFLMHQRNATSLNDATVCLHEGHAHAHPHAELTVSESISLMLAGQTHVVVTT